MIEFSLNVRLPHYSETQALTEGEYTLPANEIQNLITCYPQATELLSKIKKIPEELLSSKNSLNADQCEFYTTFGGFLKFITKAYERKIPDHERFTYDKMTSKLELRFAVNGAICDQISTDESKCIIDGAIVPAFTYKSNPEYKYFQTLKEKGHIKLLSESPDFNSAEYKNYRNLVENKLRLVRLEPAYKHLLEDYSLHYTTETVKENGIEKTRLVKEMN